MKSNVLIALSVLLLALTACGLPVNELTANERQAEMKWAFTIFEHNYAPAELKKTNFGVEISQIEADCTDLAAEDIDNQAFLALFQKCIHLFKDAHVGGQQMNNGFLPEYARVAHLGFLTLRTKVNIQGEMVEALRIISPLKGSDSPAAPMVIGDLILEANGQKVDEYMMAEIVPYINVGQDETSLSRAAFQFGVRTSMDMALPQEEDIKLKVLRNGTQFEITLPWITEDLLTFQLQQNPPQDEAEEELEGEGAEKRDEDSRDRAREVLSTQSVNALAQSFYGYEQLKEVFNFFDDPVEAVTNRLKLIAKTGFQVVKFNPVLSSLFRGELDKDGLMDQALKARILPMAVQTDDLMAEPLFTAKAVTTDKGQTYAYIQLTSFPAEDKILTEWHRAITAIEDKGIKSVIIDMIDNSGGSLIHGMRILNMVHKKPILYPSMQVRLNNNWMTSFKTEAAFGVDDYSKTIAKRVVKKLEEDKAAGQIISRPLPLTVLDPFFLQNPSYGLSDDVKIALMVNEFCVSMCDIFASVFQDNNMGVVVGQRTMGGGGNVVQHGLSPVAKIGLAVTESLIISPKGKHLEDEGVTPDIDVDMVADRELGFKRAFDAAFDHVIVEPQQ